MSKIEMLPLSDSVKDLVGRIQEQKAITVGKDGQVTVTDKLMEKFLPDGMTMAQIKQTDDFKGDLYAAATDVVARGFVEAAGSGKVTPTKNSNGQDIIKLEAQVPMYGREVMNLSYTHATQRPNMQGERDADGKLPTYTSFGEMDMSVRSPAMNKKGGELKKIFANTKALAEAASKK